MPVRNILLCLALLQMHSPTAVVVQAALPAHQNSGTVAQAPTAEQVPDLIEHFSEWDNAGARASYAKVVQIGEPAIPYLAKALKDPRKNVRWVSVRALGAIGGEEVLPPLLKALKDGDKDVRRYAAFFLGKWGAGNKEVAAALHKALYDRNRQVVWHVILGLDQLGDTSYKRDTRLVNALCQRLKSTDDECREHAADALAMIGSPRACAPLVKALAYPKATPRCRATIGRTIARIGSRDAVPLLVALLTDQGKKKDARYSAAQPLRELADPDANERILPLTTSSEEWLREAAVIALGFKDNAAAVARLSEMAEDENERYRVRECAAESLGRIGDPRGINSLAKALVAKKDLIRRKAAWALGETRSPKAVPALLKALDDPSGQVVKYAAQALGKIGDKKTAPAIVELFDRDDALGATASAPHFVNLATVAHHALVAITKEDVASEVVTQQTMSMITSKQQLDAVREAWRKKLGLQETASPSPGQ